MVTQYRQQTQTVTLVLDPNGTGTVDVSSAKITSVATPSADTRCKQLKDMLMVLLMD